MWTSGFAGSIGWTFYVPCSEWIWYLCQIWDSSNCVCSCLIFYFVCLVLAPYCFYYCSSEIYCEICTVNPFRADSLMITSVFQDLLCFYINFQIFFSIFVKKVIWVFIWISLTLLVAFGRMALFTLSVLSMHEDSRIFSLLMSSLTRVSTV